MSEPQTPPWTDDLGTAVNFQSAAALLLGTVGATLYQKISPSTDTLLECCRKELDAIKRRLDIIPPERRDQIQAMVKRGDCKSFQVLETTLLESVSSTDVYVRVFKAFHLSRLSDDHCELKERSKNTPGWKRNLPGIELRTDIFTLRDGLERLSTDTCVRGKFGFQYIQVFTCLHIDRTQQTPPREELGISPHNSPRHKSPRLAQVHHHCHLFFMNRLLIVHSQGITPLDNPGTP